MHCWGELKSLRAQSVSGVSSYWSCVQFSGYVEMKVSQTYHPVSGKWFVQLQTNKFLRTFQHCTNHVENPVGKSMEQDNWVIPTENFQEQWKI